MRGSLVIARDYRGRPLVRRVWECGAKVVYISEESQFQQLSTGGDGLRPVGFPVEDVFIYDPLMENAIRQEVVDWSTLREFGALSRHSKAATNPTFVSSE
jgi:hypothetical protein